MADRTVWEIATKERAGIRWDSVVDKVWKELLIIVGNQEDKKPMERFGGCKTEVKERMEVRERLALRNKVSGDEQLEPYGGKGRYRDDHVFSRPN